MADLVRDEFLRIHNNGIVRGIRSLSIRREYLPEDDNFVYLTIEISRGPPLSASRHETTKKRDKCNAFYRFRDETR